MTRLLSLTLSSRLQYFNILGATAHHRRASGYSELHLIRWRSLLLIGRFPELSDALF